MIEAVGTLEYRPHLAVALSGGADSMALCRLAADWALARGGRVTALTVDHRLRPESARSANRSLLGCGGPELSITYCLGLALNPFRESSKPPVMSATGC
ncbi:MAG: hypothetical protein IPK78_12350 [Rhodospirillales bacterium]|nr:hypothetical protein [Rhodospirillales bacterium]